MYHFRFYKNKTRLFDFENRRCYIFLDESNKQMCVIDSNGDKVVMSRFGINRRQLKILARQFLIDNNILKEPLFRRRQKPLKHDQ